jgi:hypothetical protein
MGSDDLHGLAARGVDLLPSRCTASNVHNDPFLDYKWFKRNILYMMIGIKNRVFCVNFKNL